MSWWGRLRFLTGIIGVLLIVGLLVLYLNNAMSTVRALRAEIGADTSNVGIDYPGLITRQYVTAGDKIRTGQPLFAVNSPLLAADIANHSVQTNNLPFTFDPKTQTISVTATEPGVVQKVLFPTGSYVQAGSVLATVNTDANHFIIAHFHLSPPDYARLKQGSRLNITFPDDSKAAASVYNIALENDGNTVDTVIRGRLPAQYASNAGFPVGTPVEANLKLTNRTWYQQLMTFIKQLFKPQSE